MKILLNFTKIRPKQLNNVCQALFHKKMRDDGFYFSFFFITKAYKNNVLKYKFNVLKSFLEILDFHCVQQPINKVNSGHKIL